jgi:hypothetical protein
MLRASAVFLTGLLLAVGGLPAQNEKPEKKTSKKIERGDPYEVVRLDTEKRTVVLKDEDGKQTTVTLGEDVKFLGPLGGKKTGGIEDSRLQPGSKVRVVRSGNRVTEVIFGYRPRKSKTTTDDEPAPTKTKAKTKKKVTAPEKTEPTDTEKPKTKAKPKTTKKTEPEPADTEKSDTEKPKTKASRKKDKDKEKEKEKEKEKKTDA